MEIRLVPLTETDQYFLDGAVDADEITSMTGVALSLYGDKDRLHAIIEDPDLRSRQGAIRPYSGRLQICRNLDAYAAEVLSRLPPDRRASLLGCGVLHAIRAMADLAEVCAHWAHEDETTGGAMLPYRRHWRCDDKYNPTSRVLRRINGRRWIARYLRSNDSVASLQATIRRLLALCDVAPMVADDHELTADLNHQMDAFRAAWISVPRSEDYIGAQGYDAPTMQTHALPGVNTGLGAARRSAGQQVPYRVIRKTRKVAKRAAVMAAALLGASTVGAFARGEPVVIPGLQVSLRLTMNGSMSGLGHGHIAVAAMAPDQTTHLADLCVYIDKTPALDQLTAMALHMQAGLEAEVLSTANVIRTSPAGIDHPLLNRDRPSQMPWLGGRLAVQRAARHAYWARTRTVWLREMLDVVIGNDRRARLIMRAAADELSASGIGAAA